MLDVVNDLVRAEVAGLELDGTCPPEGLGCAAMAEYIKCFENIDTPMYISTWLVLVLGGYTKAEHDGSKRDHFEAAFNAVKAHGAYLANKATQP